MRLSELFLKEKIESMYFIEDMFSRKRDLAHVIPRILFVNIIRQHTNMTFDQIGKLVQRNHSTVIHLVNQWKPFMQTDEYFRDSWNELIEYLKEMDFDDYKKPIDEPKKVINIKPYEKHLDAIAVSLDSLIDKSKLNEVVAKLEIIVKATNNMSRVVHQKK